MRTRFEESGDAEQRFAMLSRMLKTAQVSDPEVATSGDSAEAVVKIEATFGERAMKLVMRLGLVKDGEGLEARHPGRQPGRRSLNGEMTNRCLTPIRHFR